MVYRFPGSVGRGITGPSDEIFRTTGTVVAFREDAFHLPFGFVVHDYGRRRNDGALGKRSQRVAVATELGDMEHRVDAVKGRGELKAYGDGVDNVDDREGSGESR